MMGEQVIVLTDLTKQYGNFTAVDHIRLNIRKGEIFGLLGPNGAGKSTTILMMLGLTEPTSGTVEICGINSTTHPIEVKRRIGYLPEDVGFYDDMTGPENLIYTARLNGIPDKEAKTKAMELMKRVGLEDQLAKKTGKYSRGMRQRLGLADVLIKNPEIIILDEPAAALDPRHTTMVNRIVEQMTASGITVLMATHDVNYAYEWADKVILFHEGKVLMNGSPEEVFGNRAALRQTNLEPPAVLELFESLCKKGILKSSLPFPKNLKALEGYIEEVNLNTYYGGKKQMSDTTKKAILAVSFGTSHNDTREVTIDAIEKDMQAAFPEYPLYRAWTSKMIINKVNKEIMCISIP